MTTVFSPQIIKENKQSAGCFWVWGKLGNRGKYEGQLLSYLAQPAQQGLLIV